MIFFSFRVAEASCFMIPNKWMWQTSRGRPLLSWSFRLTLRLDRGGGGRDKGTWQITCDRDASMDRDAWRAVRFRTSIINTPLSILHTPVRHKPHSTSCQAQALDPSIMPSRGRPGPLQPYDISLFLPSPRSEGKRSEEKEDYIYKKKKKNFFNKILIVRIFK